MCGLHTERSANGIRWFTAMSSDVFSWFSVACAICFANLCLSRTQRRAAKNSWGKLAMMFHVHPYV